MNKHTFTKNLISVLILVIVIYFMPWSRVNWGKIQMQPSATITVTGQAQKEERNEVANFSAGVTVQKEDKDEAVNEVNQKVSNIIAAVKEFGVPEKNIQTQNISINERRPEPNDQSQDRGWMVSNTINITLEDGERASELTDLLAESAATNVYGPRFSLSKETRNQADLMAAAVEDAKEKAETAAEASGQKLGKIISINEGAGSGPIMPYARGLGMAESGAPVEPGTSTIGQSVTVIFELK